MDKSLPIIFSVYFNFTLQRTDAQALNTFRLATESSVYDKIVWETKNCSEKLIFMSHFHKSTSSPRIFSTESSMDHLLVCLD